jgi:hypothetical protein
MHTPPADLPEPALRAALEVGWSLRAATLVYRPVGFGSHHWELTDTAGGRRFVTVDDLRSRRVTVGEPLSAGYDRLRAALAAAQALRAAGRDFVVAPLPSRDGEPLARLADAFAVAVYPFVAGESFDSGNYSPEHRRAVLDLVVSVHAAAPQVRGRALPDDYAIAFRDAVAATLDRNDAGDPGLGPYARPAAALLAAHAPGVRHALARYDTLVRAARADPAGPVLTHGEPHPGNTIRAGGGWLPAHRLGHGTGGPAGTRPVGPRPGRREPARRVHRRHRHRPAPGPPRPLPASLGPHRNRRRPGALPRIALRHRRRPGDLGDSRGPGAAGRGTAVTARSGQS